MDQSAFDIAMKFVLKGGGTVWAESALQVHPEDPLMKDFKPISSYDDYSNFFEVQSFDFSMNVEPMDAGTGNLSRPGMSGRPGVPTSHRLAGNLIGAGQGLGGQGAGGKGGAPTPGESGDPFHRWRSAKEEEARKIRFTLTFDSFGFDRVIDSASTTFFQSCSRQETFDSAALIKRVSMGQQGTKSGQTMAFMRFDFTDVILKGVKWSDGDLVTEHCDFVCNSMTYRYRQQKADGSLLSVQDHAVWDRKKDAERKVEATK